MTARKQAELEAAEVPLRRSVRVLENAELRVEVAPERGGKFLSLRSKRTATEWLLPPLRPYDRARSDGGFEDWDGGGFDECLPTVAAADPRQDHGELWRHAWEVTSATADSIAMSTAAIDNALGMERRAKLAGASLLLDYTLENRSHAPQTLLYSAHPLLRVERYDRILLPAEVRSVLVEATDAAMLGRHGDRVAWPSPRGFDDLSFVGPPNGLQADKVFAGPLTRGWCALVRPSLGEGVELTFSQDALPYLGVWMCLAAWPPSGDAKQFTVAFEPTGTPCDSLAEAMRAGTAWALASGERHCWQLCFRVAPAAEIAARQAGPEGQ